MENLIQEALDQAHAKLESQVPQTKKIPKTISITGVKPTELTEFMQQNNVPDTAYFTGTDNGYDGYDDIVLEWQVEVPTTDNEKSEYRQKRFHDIAFSSVYHTLVDNGYTRIGLAIDRNRISYKRCVLGSSTVMFDGKTIYEWYTIHDFDKLIEYYSLYYTLKK